MNVTPAFKKSALDAKLAEGTLKMMFLNTGHTENLTTQIYSSDVNVNEISSGGGYPTSGITLSGVSSTMVGSGAVLDFDDISVTGIDSSTQGIISSLVVYVDTGTATTSEIIAQQTLGSDRVLSATDTYNITVNTNGLISIN